MSPLLPLPSPPPSNLVLPCVPCCRIAIQLHLDGPILCHGNAYRFLKKTHSGSVNDDAQGRNPRKSPGSTAAPNMSKEKRGGACFAPKFDEDRRRLEEQLTTCLPTYPSFTIALACTGACARSRFQLIRTQAATCTNIYPVHVA